METERLVLRRLATGDADFVLELVNDPAWLRYIGDKGVHTLADARDYILQGPITMYKSHGFGLFLVGLKENSLPIGLCGLIKRDFLEDVDIGFALLPGFRAQGYAYESAAAVLAYGRQVFDLDRIVAIIAPGNVASANLLLKLGFEFEQELVFDGAGRPARLFAWGVSPSGKIHGDPS